MAGMDDKKRKFLKHLGIITVGGVLGMALTKISARSTETVINNYADRQISLNEKMIWASMTDFSNPENRLDYKAYLIKANSGRNLPMERTGAPVINEGACAFDTIIPAEESGSGTIEHITNTYCTSPCRRICPVSAIDLKDNPNTDKKEVPTFKNNGKDKKTDMTNGFDSDCIGCGKCFKVCGYNAIHWVNRSD